MNCSSLSIIERQCNVEVNVKTKQQQTKMWDSLSLVIISFPSVELKYLASIKLYWECNNYIAYTKKFAKIVTLDNMVTYVF